MGISTIYCGRDTYVVGRYDVIITVIKVGKSYRHFLYGFFSHCCVVHVAQHADLVDVADCYTLLTFVVVLHKLNQKNCEKLNCWDKQ